MKKARKLNETIRSNIKGLRMSVGETQDSLASELGVSRGTIGNYESGTRVPTLEMLVKIATHFEVTVDSLLHDNFSTIPEIGERKIVDRGYSKALLDCLLPMVNSIEAQKNKGFRDAYKIHVEIYEQCLETKTVHGGLGEHDIDLDKCMDLYAQAKKEGVQEAVANRLWLELFVGLVTVIASPYLMDNMEQLIRPDAKVKDLATKGLLPKFGEDASDEYDIEHEQERQDFLEVFELDMLSNIRILKRSRRYADLGDYYFAQCYVNNLVRNGHNKATNRAIGIELLNRLNIMNNGYAKSFCRFFHSYNK